MNNIENKVIVITGASSGLGEATARLLAKKGAKVVLGARRTEKLEAIVHDIRAEGGQAEFIGMDITKPHEVQALIEKALSAFGQIDVLVNNAGLMSIAPLSELKVDEWDRMIDINIKGVLYGIAARPDVHQSHRLYGFLQILFVPAGNGTAQKDSYE